MDVEKMIQFVQGRNTSAVYHKSFTRYNLLSVRLDNRTGCIV